MSQIHDFSTAVLAVGALEHIISLRLLEQGLDFLEVEAIGGLLLHLEAMAGRMGRRFPTASAFTPVSDIFSIFAISIVSNGVMVSVLSPLPHPGCFPRILSTMASRSSGLNGFSNVSTAPSAIAIVRRSLEAPEIARTGKFE